MELPKAFENRMKSLLGAEYEAFYEALCHEDAVKGLRVNLHKASPDAFAANAPFPLEPIPYVKGGYIVSEEAHAGKHAYHHAGAYYMQDPGAMASVAALPDSLWEREGLKILDLCAAPGGKTTQMAALCAEKGGAVLANEYVSARSRILAGNVERMGLDNVLVTNVDSKHIAAWYPDFFDLVVVDAPCSGEGMYRKNDLAISEWSPENVAMCAERQREILENAAKNVAPGGWMLYSTCTYSTEENEGVVAEFLDRHPDFSLIPCNDSVIKHTSDGVDVSGGARPELSLCRRFYPHVSPGEGQFAALLCRADGGEVANPVKDASVALSKNDAAVVNDFTKETLGHTLPGLCLCGSNASAFPAREHLNFPIPPFGVVAVGAVIGEVRKGRIVPHHHFFMAYGQDFYLRCLLEPDDPAVAGYLAGEEISADVDGSGFAAVLVKLGEGGVPLGGGKLSGGRLKNYYPKGLRVR